MCVRTRPIHSLLFHRIALARLAFDGSDYELARNFGDHPHAIHGVGWQRPWALAAHEATHALLTFEHEPAGERARAWPWPLLGRQSLSLHAHRDAAGATLAQIDDRESGYAAFPFGLGWHPFFVRTAPRIGFRARGVWERTRPACRRRHVSSHRSGGVSPPGSGVATIDNVFTGWDGEATLADVDRGIAVTVRADRAMGFLVVYAPAGKSYLALEPVTHMTDAFNRDARGELGTGSRTLRPGAAFSCTMEIGVRLLP